MACKLNLNKLLKTNKPHKTRKSSQNAEPVNLPQYLWPISTKCLLGEEIKQQAVYFLFIIAISAGMPLWFQISMNNSELAIFSKNKNSGGAGRDKLGVWG